MELDEGFIKVVGDELARKGWLDEILLLGRVFKCPVIWVQVWKFRNKAKVDSFLSKYVAVALVFTG